MVSDEALKKLQEQIAAWPMAQRFVVQQLIEDYSNIRKDLLAYKNTGMTPERCAEFARADAEGRYIVMRDAEQEGVARLRELAEADKGGRLVVLPCKVGDTVWTILDGKKHVCKCIVEFINIGGLCTTVVLCKVNGSREQYGATAASFSKTVFLTREEAEKALEAMKDD